MTLAQTSRTRDGDKPLDRRRRMGLVDNGVGIHGEMSQDEVDEYMAKAMSHPAHYGRMILGCDVYPAQEQIMDAMLRFDNVAVAGCNASGKTFSMTPYSLWKLSTVRPEMGILQIAPTQAQSRSVYWRDMRSQYQRSKWAQQVFLEIMRESAIDPGRVLQPPPMRNLSFEIEPKRYAQALTPGDEESVRGYHAQNLLFFMDEGNAINADYFAAVRGVTASGQVQVVQMGNPVENSGLFYDCFDNPELGWYTINVSAFDSVNLLSLEVPEWFEDISEAPGDISEEDRKKLAYLVYLRRQYLRKRLTHADRDIEEYRILRDDVTPHQTSRLFVAQAEADWAKTGDPSWYGRVLGVFPNESESQMFSRRAIDGARTRVGEVSVFREGQGELVWGLDPNGAGQNEFAVIGVQIDNRTTEHAVVFEWGFTGWDAFDQAIRAIEPYMPYTHHLSIDRMGAGERPTFELKQWAEERWGKKAYAVVSHKPSTNPDSFQNLRAQMYFVLRDMLEMGLVTGIDSAELRQQMLSMRFEITDRGQWRMERKRDMQKRGVKSPDRVDALVYACFPWDLFVPWHGFLGAV